MAAGAANLYPALKHDTRASGVMQKQQVPGLPQKL